MSNRKGNHQKPLKVMVRFIEEEQGTEWYCGGGGETRETFKKVKVLTASSAIKRSKRKTEQRPFILIIRISVY